MVIIYYDKKISINTMFYYDIANFFKNIIYVFIKIEHRDFQFDKITLVKILNNYY